MVQPILLLGNPTLRVKCRPVKMVDTSAIHSTIADLRDTLYDFKERKGFGRGIAAPQIGVTQRIIFIHIDKPVALINPGIVRKTKKVFSLWDDCFSFPDLLVKVRRHSSIEVAYQNELGEKRFLKARDALSELLQHEIDHLDGILAIDRAIDPKYIVLRSEYSKLVQKKSRG